MPRVKFGVQALQGMPDYLTLRNVVLECEQLSFDSIWVYDHLHFTYGPTFECWTVLSALAEATETIRLGSLVTCNLFRSPLILAKMAATLDMISGGRLIFGIGAGWLKEEALAYGIKFPKGSERVEMLEEALSVIERLWTEDETTFNGKYYSAKRAICLPKPVQKPHPPILVGGGAPKMLRVIARHADAWDVGFMNPPEVSAMVNQLQQVCSEVDRTPNLIENTYQSRVVIARSDEAALARAEKWRKERGGKKDDPDWKNAIVGSPDTCVAKMKPLVDAGITHFTLLFADAAKLDPLRLFAKEVIPAFRKPVRRSSSPAKKGK